MGCILFFFTISTGELTDTEWRFDRWADCASAMVDAGMEDNSRVYGCRRETQTEQEKEQ